MNLSLPRSHLAGAAAGNFALFAGGWKDRSTPSLRVDLYDTSTRTWLPCTNLSVPRYYLAGAAAGDLVLFAGGENESSTLATVDV
jgi:hypothetical protein